MRLITLPLLAIALASPLSAHAGQLGRAVSLGLTGGTGATGDNGVRVQSLVDGYGGKALGLRQGDLLVAVDGTPVADMPALARMMYAKAAGTPITLEVIRDGQRKQLRGKAPARPLETFVNGTADLGAVAFQGGLLRDIMVTPKQDKAGPVLFLIQGYTCASVETSGPQSSHRQLIDGLLARGISTYRIEKPGAGDSRGGPACADIDFATELAAFRAGYDALVEKRGISPDRIFILGHSLGGIEAPLLASPRTPRGVAVYGTVLRNWQDYMFDVIRLQGFIGTGEDPAKGEARSEEMRILLHDLFVNRKAPSEVAGASVDKARLLREFMDWDGGTQIYGRHYSYWQGLADLRLVSAWRDVRANVLSIHGESDVAALSSADHQMIAEVVNHYRPGTARYVGIPLTGHGMRIEGTLADVRAASAPDASAKDGGFNPVLVPTIADWIMSVYKPDETKACC